MSDSIRRNSLQIKPLQLPRDDNLDIRQAILDGPILLTMLRLAWPTILVLVAQVAVGVAEIFYVSFLGTTALAGVALVSARDQAATKPPVQLRVGSSFVAIRV